jgi:Helix-turn-helix domain
MASMTTTGTPVPDLIGLTGHQTILTACAMEAALGAERRNQTPPGHELRQLAAKIVMAVPSAVIGPSGEVRLPSLLDASGLRACAVKAEARRLAASRLAADSGGPASSSIVTLQASEAARIAGVSPQAIRAAASARRLVAAKDRVTGAWRIPAAALDEWLETRHP